MQAPLTLQPFTVTSEGFNLEFNGPVHEFWEWPANSYPASSISELLYAESSTPDLGEGDDFCVVLPNEPGLCRNASLQTCCRETAKDANLPSSTDWNSSPGHTVAKTPIYQDMKLAGDSHITASSSNMKRLLSAREQKTTPQQKSLADAKHLKISSSIPESSTVRSGHNMTEKRYRSRLNDQFETLLSALPATSVAAMEGSSSRSEPPGRRISKAEVLILAKEHIRDLEDSREALAAQNRKLMIDMEQLVDVWNRLAGQALP